MQDNEIQGYLELSMQADTFLKSLSINHYLSLPLYLVSDCTSGADLLNWLSKQGLFICPNWLYHVPFQSSFEELIHERIIHDNYPSSTHWLDYVLDKYIKNKESLDKPFKVETYETSINSLLASYTIGISNSKILDEAPLMIIFIALRAIIAKRLIKENIQAIRNDNESIHDIEIYF